MSMSTDDARDLIARTPCRQTDDLARTIGRLTGMAGFEPASHDLEPGRHVSDAVFIGEMLSLHQRQRVESVLVANPRGQVSVWVRSTDFWMLP